MLKTQFKKWKITLIIVENYVERVEISKIFNVKFI